VEVDLQRSQWVTGVPTQPATQNHRTNELGTGIHALTPFLTRMNAQLRLASQMDENAVDTVSTTNVKEEPIAKSV
jgi:hypothetical protein